MNNILDVIRRKNGIGIEEMSAKTGLSLIDLSRVLKDWKNSNKEELARVIIFFANKVHEM